MKMKGIYWLLIIVAIILCLGVGFIVANEKDTSSSGYKYAKSEYTKCMDAMNDANIIYELDMAECTRKGLQQYGYTDGIDCIMDYDRYSICDGFDRYNAEVDISNDCMYLVVRDGPNMFDCAELI